MSAEISTRIAAEVDLDAVKHLYDVVVDTDRGTEYDVLWRRDLHPSDASIEAAVGAGELFVAEKDGRMIGAGIVNSDFACGYENVCWPSGLPQEEARCLHLFCVHPEHRGGTGRIFLNQMAQILREQGVGAVRLDTFDYNTAARRMYEKAGYVYAGPGHMTYDDQQVSHILFAMYELVL